MTEDSSIVDGPLEYLFAIVPGLPESLSSTRLPSDIPVFAWLLVIPLVYLAVYWRFVVRRPVLHGRDDGFKRFLVSSCPILSELYAPIVWAWHCHANTVFRAMCQRIVTLNYKRQLLSLPDGGVLALDWAEVDPHHDKPATPILLILPGLSGFSYSNYITQFVSDGLQQGYRPVVLNHRGNGDHMLKTPRTYSARSIDDLNATLHTIQQQFPDAKIVTLAVSLGSMQLIHYLHETGHNSAVSAAMLISTIWDPFSSRQQLEHQLINRTLYVRFLISRIKQMIRRNLAVFRTSKAFDIDRVLESKLISEMDACFTVPMFEYPSLEEYYTMACTGHKLKDIKRPVLAVSALDDPFVAPDSLPVEPVNSNPLTVLAVTKHGGHFGFMEGLSPRGPSWMNRMCKQFLSAVKNLPPGVADKTSCL